MVGHLAIGASALADTKLSADATQLVVTEAKLFSPLASGVTNASYYDQAARNVACFAELLHRAGRSPDQMNRLSFIILAPVEQIDAGLFKRKMAKQSIRDKVCRRVDEYGDKAKTRWLNEWFLPVLTEVGIECLSWEEIIDHINSLDSAYGQDLHGFYELCIRHNR